VNVLPHAHPVLNCEDSRRLEALVLTDEELVWDAMCRAGRGIAAGILRDYQELRPVPDRLRILALVGKGNNGGDALIACGQLLADFPRAQVDLILTVKADDLKSLAARALRRLEGRVKFHSFESGTSADASSLLDTISGGHGFDLCIDGIVGMDFRPPLREPIPALLEAVNEHKSIDLRAAVDLPSGRGDESDAITFSADFTYATGVVKKPLFKDIAESGRVRYIDLGFFDQQIDETFKTEELVLEPSVLKPLNCFRPAHVDKRSFGHLYIVGGSAYMPGALLMSVQSAVRSGVGRVTAFAPQSVAASLSAQVPEAMWVPWPETSNGTLSPRALPLLTDRIDSASAVLVGPGLGYDRDIELLLQIIVNSVECPLILDADALRPRAVEVAQKRKAHFGEVILTPHMGEFMRVAKIPEPDYTAETILEFSKIYRVITVLKSAHTRICNGEQILYNIAGGPVLSRGGSGDLLAGLMGGMIAQFRSDVFTAAARGVMLHGLAAQRLARDRGQRLVRTTQLLDYLPDVLRSYNVN